MPPCFNLSWDGRHRRWWKQFRGKKYVVSCQQLNAPETKIGSYQQANTWWEAKRAEILGQVPPHEHAEYLDTLGKRLDWARGHGQGNQVEELKAEIDRIRKGGRPRHLETLGFVIAETLVETPEQYEAELVARAFDPCDPVWADRVVQGGIETTPEDLRVGAQIEAWLGLRRIKVQSGGLSACGYDNARICLYHFRDWVGEEYLVSVIDRSKWSEFWAWVSGKDWSGDYKRKVFRTARMFVEWLVRNKLIPVPVNLHDRELSFRKPIQEVPVMDVEEAVRLVREATGQLRLHLLLMLNCGMTQKDIADLKPSEVDWKDGRIVRKRSKTKDYAKSPKVNYELWPITFELLQEWRSEGPRVLVTKTGGPWVYSKLVGGKLKKTDNVATNYAHLRKRLGFGKRLKDIRKTSATMLSGRGEFIMSAVLFLGEEPKTIAEIHYLRPSDTEFDRAIRWLGKQYGFVDSEA